jgi:hypothetical protein
MSFRHLTQEDGCPRCGGEIRRWKSKTVHAWLEIWFCQECRSYTECLCGNCEVLKALAGI